MEYTLVDVFVLYLLFVRSRIVVVNIVVTVDVERSLEIQLEDTCIVGSLSYRVEVKTPPETPEVGAAVPASLIVFTSASFCVAGTATSLLTLSMMFSCP